jgi:AcrR family transcriptional regulator
LGQDTFRIEAGCCFQPKEYSFLIRSPRPGDVAFARGRCEVAMLGLSGEIGYRCVTVEQVLARSGVGLEQFKAEFGDLEGCFVAAYEAEADVLCEAMLDAAGRAGDRRAAIRAAMETLLGFFAERPMVGRALIRDVHVVGGDALAKHEEVLARLTAAISKGARLPEEQLGWTSTFVVGAVEGVVAARLARGETDEMLGLLPELMYLIVASYEGSEAATGELEQK